jgi:predicted RNase H-like HicB family nuclease
VLDRAADGSVSVVFPDLPGCVSAGEDETRAVINAHEALLLHLTGLVEDGDRLPRPSHILDLLPEWLHDPAPNARILVTALVPSADAAFSVELESEDLERLDATARSLGTTREAAAAMLLHRALTAA